MGNDYFSQTIQTQNGYVLGGNVSYYLIPYQSLSKDTNKIDIPPIEEVISLNYIPYLSSSEGAYLNNFDVENVTLDKKFLPNYNMNNITKSLKRIKSTKGSNTIVSTFEPYDYIKGTDIGGVWKWQNEGKLWNYPYHYCEIWDGVSSPLSFSSEFLDLTKSSQRVRMRYGLNTQGIYQLYIEGYQGDNIGLLKGSMTGGLPFPISNSAYLNYMANNQANLQMQKVNNVVNMGSSLLSMNVGTIASGLTSGVMNFVGEHAKQSDLKSQGLTVKDCGADSLFNLQMDEVLCKYVYGYPEDYLQRVGLMFHQYGTKQNKLMTPPINTRKYFNYVKTVNANITGDGVPKQHMESIINLFDRGVTLWHMSVNGNYVGNYIPDNKEV